MLRRLALRRFCGDARGLAAIEFAFVAPVMLAMLFGMAELTQALNARSKVSAVASTVGDLVAQTSAANKNDLNNVMNAASAIMYPATGLPTIRIMSVVRTGSSKTTGVIEWVCTRAGTGTFPASSKAKTGVKGGTVTFDNDLLEKSGDSVIMAEVAYEYASPTTVAIAGKNGKFAMYNAYYAKPRRVVSIGAPDQCPA